MPNQRWAAQILGAEGARLASGRLCDMKPFHPAGNPSLGFIADMRKMRLQLVGGRAVQCGQIARQQCHKGVYVKSGQRSEEHTSELQSLMRISYAVFCLKKKKKQKKHITR